MLVEGSVFRKLTGLPFQGRAFGTLTWTSSSPPLCGCMVKSWIPTIQLPKKACFFSCTWENHWKYTSMTKPKESEEQSDPCWRGWVWTSIKSKVVCFWGPLKIANCWIEGPVKPRILRKHDFQHILHPSLGRTSNPTILQLRHLNGRMI